MVEVEKMRFPRYGLVAVTVLIAIMLVTGSSARAADLGLIDSTALQGSPAGCVILDARPRAEWEAGHIPGAISLPWESYTRTDAGGIPYSTFPPQELATALAGLGIDEKTPVVVYGDADTSWGGEGYDAWLLSWLGHKGPIRLLNGGIQGWRGRNLPLIKGAQRAGGARPRYRVELNPSLIITTEELQRSGGTYAIVDVRSTFEWFKGRIPGAIHIPWEEFYTGKERRPLSPAELKKLLARHGVDGAKPVVYYCLGGVRSAYAWTVHHLAGLPEARNYKGSWAAWEKRSGQ